MKTIFVILLIANIAYAAGMHYYAARQTEPLPAQLNPEKVELVSSHENCLLWGNFYEEQIRYAEKVFSGLYPDVAFNLEPAGNTTMYWLYISPYPNREAANREINKLRNLGIVSFRVKDDAQWENAISLGIFYDQNDALKQMKEIEKKGVTQVKVEHRQVALQKIAVHNPSAAFKERMQALVEQFDGTKLVQGKCERL